MAVAIFQVSPRLPALWSTPYSAPGGSTIVVGDAENFQTALTNAARGDIITLNAGSTYSGNYTLPDKGAGTDYIYIRSSAALTTEGTRVTTGDLTGFPKIVSPNVSPAIQAAAGSSYYRFINCDIKSSSTAVNGYLVGFGTGEETNADDFPHHMILDRCGVRGSATNGGRRGALLGGNYQAVIDSYLSDWKEVGADTQAIFSRSGYGPYKIVNNYIEAAGENVLFGGADTGVTNCTPSDIEIRGNYFFKPLTWKVDDPSYLGTHWSVKNLLELKHAKRVLIEDNILENCWLDSQTGFAVLFTVRNQTGTNPWATVDDVTFRRNVIHHCANGFNLLGFDTDTTNSKYARRLLIERNLLYDIGLVPENSDGILFVMAWTYADVNINHNTAIHTGTIISADGLTFKRLKLTNNIMVHNAYGIKGTGLPSGNESIAQFLPGADIRKNVIVMNVEDLSAQYPANNFYPLSLNDVGFVNLTNYADLRLTEVSAYHEAALNGTDIGADLPTPA